MYVYEVKGYNRFSNYQLIRISAKSPKAALVLYLKQYGIKYAKITKMTSSVIADFMEKTSKPNAVEFVDFLVTKLDDFSPAAGGMYIIS